MVRNSLTFVFALVILTGSTSAVFSGLGPGSDTRGAVIADATVNVTTDSLEPNHDSLDWDHPWGDFAVDGNTTNYSQGYSSGGGGGCSNIPGFSEFFLRLYFRYVVEQGVHTRCPIKHGSK